MLGDYEVTPSPSSSAGGAVAPHNCMWPMHSCVPHRDPSRCPLGTEGEFGAIALDAANVNGSWPVEFPLAIRKESAFIPAPLVYNGAYFHATPALSEGRTYLRTHGTLYCFGAR